MALPPTPAGAAPPSPPMGGPAPGAGAPPGGPPELDAPAEEATEERVVAIVTEHDGPDGPSFSVYDHIPGEGGAAAGDGAVVTTSEPGEAMASVFKIMKSKGEGQANADLESGYKGEEEPEMPPEPPVPGGM